MSENIPVNHLGTVVGEIHIQIVNDNGKINVAVGSSADPLTSLGILSVAEDAFKRQLMQPASPLVVARGNVPRT